MKKLTLVLAAATVVAGFAATYLWMDLRAGRDELASLRATVTELEKEQAAAQAAAAQAAQAALAAATPAQGNTIGVPPSTPGAATSTPPAERLREGLVKGITNVLSSQAGNDLIRNQLRTTVKQMYPDLADAMRF